jgi:hypothetical protein
MTEEQPYTLVKKTREFEIRHYPSYVLIQVVTKGEFSRAASMAFRPLVNYISGSNQTNEKFAMTAPVIHSPDKSAQTHVVSFVLPKDVSIKDIPCLQTLKFPRYKSMLTMQLQLSSEV